MSSPIPAPANRIPTPQAAPPDILRCAYMELVVTDLQASRDFYVDVLDLVVTEEDENAVYLRSFEEFIHHNLVLRRGPVAAVAAFSYRVRSPEDLDRAVAFYTELGCRIERRSEGFTKGIGDSVRVEDPLGFPYEFFYDVQHVERLAWRYDLYTPGALVRLDHFNQVTPDVPRAVAYMEDLGFRVTEDIQDEEGTTYAAWMRRKPTVHDTAMTGGDGPRMHHVAFATHEKHNIIAICDKLGALRLSDRIERGPGRHGVSNAFYLYLRDPDGHRVEIYTQDYYTGDPDNPVVTWDVHDNQRRDWWGNPVVPSWYTEASLVLDLDGNPQPLVTRTDDSEMEVTIGADGFSYTARATRRRASSSARRSSSPLHPLDPGTPEFPPLTARTSGVPAFRAARRTRSPYLRISGSPESAAGALPHHGEAARVDAVEELDDDAAEGLIRPLVRLGLPGGRLLRCERRQLARGGDDGPPVGRPERLRGEPGRRAAVIDDAVRSRGQLEGAGHRRPVREDERVRDEHVGIDQVDPPLRGIGLPLRLWRRLRRLRRHERQRRTRLAELGRSVGRPELRPVLRRRAPGEHRDEGPRERSAREQPGATASSSRHPSPVPRRSHPDGDYPNSTSAARSTANCWSG